MFRNKEEEVEMMSQTTVNKREQEMKDIASKVVLMTPQSIQTLILATDVLLMRDQMEHGGQDCEER